MAPFTDKGSAMAVPQSLHIAENPYPTLKGGFSGFSINKTTSKKRNGSL